MLCIKKWSLLSEPESTNQIRAFFSGKARVVFDLLPYNLESSDKISFFLRNRVAIYQLPFRFTWSTTILTFKTASLDNKSRTRTNQRFFPQSGQFVTGKSLSTLPVPDCDCYNHGFNDCINKVNCQWHWSNPDIMSDLPIDATLSVGSYVWQKCVLALSSSFISSFSFLCPQV